MMPVYEIVDVTSEAAIKSSQEYALKLSLPFHP